MRKRDRLLCLLGLRTPCSVCLAVPLVPPAGICSVCASDALTAQRKADLRALQVEVRDLKWGQVVLQFKSNPVWEVHTGPVVQTSRPLPEGPPAWESEATDDELRFPDPDKPPASIVVPDSPRRQVLQRGFRCNVGELLADPAGYGVPHGEPVRFWALSPERRADTGGGVGLTLFEVLP